MKIKFQTSIALAADEKPARRELLEWCVELEDPRTFEADDPEEMKKMYTKIWE